MLVFWQEHECCMHILTDITEMQQVQGDKSRNQYQRIMMSNVSHEYRTPLNAIITSTQLNIKRVDELISRVGKRVGDKLWRIQAQVNIEQASSKLMLHLVNSMIDMS